VELHRAIVCCKIVKRKWCEVDSLPYLIAAEATSAKFNKLYLQGKIRSKHILDLMGRLEKELGGPQVFS
jgi:hypothetical protein